MATLYEMKEKLATVGAQLQAIEAEIVEKAANPAIPIEDISALEKQRDDIQKRFDLLQTQHDRMEEEQQAKLRKQPNFAGDEKAQILAAKADYYRSKILGREPSSKTMEILNANPLIALPASAGTGGEDLLPTTMVNELVHEPFVNNPLRPHIGMTAIKGLELPKIAFSLDDAAFINDAVAAKEIQLTGDKVSFGRNKFKVKVRIADTVLHGSDANLVGYVEGALRSGLAAKEKDLSFKAHASVGDYGHMSFYTENGSGATLIETVTKATMFEAITAAIADLHEDFRENAKVCMKYSDYVTMLSTLSNSSRPLYGVQPSEVIGKPVFFSDAATTPIIGDFRYYHLNYDPEVIYDADKDVNKGEYIWVITAWIDQQFKLRSAFRLARVQDEG